MKDNDAIKKKLYEIGLDDGKFDVFCLATQLVIDSMIEQFKSLENELKEEANGLSFKQILQFIEVIKNHTLEILEDVR